MRRTFIYLPLLIIMMFLMASCADITSVTDLLEPGPPELDSQTEVETPGPVEIVLVEPTPTGIPVGQTVYPPILFVSNRGKARTQDIYQVNADGSGLIRLVDDPGIASDPSWSPDQRLIAFASDRSGINQVYLLRIEDMEVTRLTDHPMGAISPTWSPDGRQLAFAEQDTQSGSILVTNLTEENQITSHSVGVIGVRNPTWMPQGDTIAFSGLAEDPLGELDIYKYELDSKSLENLTNHPGNDDKPAWAPDGERILFYSDRDGDENVYIMQANGSLQTPLTDDPAADVDPDWAGDDRTVVFSSNRDGGYDLYLMNESGGDQRALTTSTSDDRQPHWFSQPLPSSDDLVVAVGIAPPPYNLSLISASGSQETAILDNDDSDDTMPDWSPDGRNIVFASNTSGSYDIYVLEPDGNKTPQQITVHAGADMHPAWSPNGEKIAFESKRDEGDWDIWVINVDGSDLRNLTPDSNANDGNPGWSPDGKEIVFSSDRDQDFDLYVMSTDGTGEIRRLTNLPGEEYHPDWSPDGNEIAFRHTNPDTGQSQIYIVNRDGRAPVQLFSGQSNDDSPAWSPNSRWLAFVSDAANPGFRNQPGKFDVYIYDLWSSEISQVTSGDKSYHYPAWKPSGTSPNP